MKYVRYNGLDWDVLEDKECDSCGKVHPIKVNELLGGISKKQRLIDMGYTVIESLKALDEMTGKCDPDSYKDDDEEDESEDDSN